MKPLFSSLLIAMLAVPVAAQRPAAPAGGPREYPDPAAMRGREGDDLALVLGLLAAQRPALDAYLAAGAMHRPEGPPPGAVPPTFERELAGRRERLAARSAEESGRIEAAARFYTQLDARQRRLFEAVMRLRHGPGGHGPEGPGGDRPGGGPLG